MSYKIVISRYNESLEWTRKMKRDNLIIYNKGEDIIENTIKRKNVGREGETFLHHIIANYNNLPDYLILVQGYPFDHMTDINEDNFQIKIHELIQQKIDNVQTLFTEKHIEWHECCVPLKVKEYFSHFFKEEISEDPVVSVFAAGSQYIIPKQNILHRPIQFYKKIHYMLLNALEVTVEDANYSENEFTSESINGWTLERLFMYMFRKDIEITNFYTL
jgi:hypothetical protein